jgi:hypothetical protein
MEEDKIDVFDIYIECAKDSEIQKEKSLKDKDKRDNKQCIKLTILGIIGSLIILAISLLANYCIN